MLFDGIAAPLVAAGPTELDAVVPSEVGSRQTTTLQVLTPTGQINGPTLQVSPSQTGVLLSSAPNTTLFAPPAAALNQDGSVNSAANPATLGTIVSVWVNGAGASSYPVPDGTVRTSENSGAPVLSVAAFSTLLGVFSGGALPGPLSLEVVYAGDAAGMVAGVTQVNFLLPAQVEYAVDYIGFLIQVGDTQSGVFTLYLQTPQ